MACAAALLLVFSVAAGPVRTQMSGTATVTNGDTLKVGAEQVRLHGIDAPESRQTCRAGGKTWRSVIGRAAHSSEDEHASCNVHRPRCRIERERHRGGFLAVGTAAACPAHERVVQLPAFVLVEDAVREYPFDLVEELAHVGVVRPVVHAEPALERLRFRLAHDAVREDPCASTVG